jgi:hypothetical protein
LRTRAALAAGLLAAATLPVAAAPSPVLGGQVTLAFPQGDLNGGKWMHGRTGLGLGLHCIEPLDGGHAVNLRGDCVWIQQGQVNILTGDGSTQLYAEQAKVRILSLSLDYEFYFSGDPHEGPYFFIGLGQSWMSHTDASLAPGGVGAPVAWPGSSSASAVQWSLGVGSKFRPRLGYEFRFTQANYSGVGIGGTSMKTPMFTLALTTDF